MVWVAGGHDAEIDLEDLLPELESWFGRYLDQDGSSPDTEFEVTVTRPSLVGQDTDDPEPRTLRVAGYPGRGSALLTRTIDLDGPEQTVLFPPGGIPTALTSLPGSGGLLGAVSTVGGYQLAVLPGQAATFTSAPLTKPDTLVGSGAVNLQVTSSGTAARLFVGLWDLGPDISAAPAGGGPAIPRPGTAVLPGAAIAPVALTGLTPGRPTTIRVVLPPVAHEAPVGHRWQLVVSSTDQAYALPNAVATYQIVLAGEGSLTLPRVTGTSVGAGRLDVPPALVGSVGALLVVAGGAAAASWARHRTRVVRPDLASLPLVVDGLVKVYPVRRRGRELLHSRAAAPAGGGVRAVESVSFRAEPGQVVGLLGPNGAGKTTTMRMMVGLIRPDAGTVYVRGEPVDGGAEVLSSVGALIEGPGFLPHLSGRENLEAFWAATGRPVEEAYLDEALAIAGLGRAVERPVRGYSQGMRQRLGIAQAMLGRPSLLLLDEPTNGLDPPQIKAMRSVLQDYAATGRTVVISSHLLAEVQQTCSHVVVMHQGRVVLTGSMAELTATEDVTVVELAAGSDPAAARAVLQQAGAKVTGAGTGLRITGDIPRPRLVELLVRAGFAIDAIDGRRQLEEVFMSLVDPQGESRG